MILDAVDRPEAMPKFYNALVGRGEFVNGTRLGNQAMRRLNFIANRNFAVLFSYLLNQRFTDTLCQHQGAVAPYEQMHGEPRYPLVSI